MRKQARGCPRRVSRRGGRRRLAWDRVALLSREPFLERGDGRLGRLLGR